MKILTGDAVTVRGIEYGVIGVTRKSKGGANGWLRLQGADGTEYAPISPKGVRFVRRPYRFKRGAVGARG